MVYIDAHWTLLTRRTAHGEVSMIDIHFLGLLMAFTAIQDARRQIVEVRVLHMLDPSGIDVGVGYQYESLEEEFRFGGCKQPVRFALYRESPISGMIRLLGEYGLVKVRSARFKFARNNLDVFLRSISRLRSIEYLWFQSDIAGGLTDQHISQLPKMRQLRLLYVADSLISDSAVKHFQNFENLEILDISYTKIGDGAIPELKRLKKLRLLLIERAAFSEDGKRMLRQALPDCCVVDDTLIR